MKLTWDIEDQDIEKVGSFYTKWSNDPFVRLRQKRNTESPRPTITKEYTWMALVGCLLTTQQRSGSGSAVKRILDNNPFPLNYNECSSKGDLEKFARETLTSFRGIRRPPTIAQQISNNHEMLEKGLWPVLLSRAQEINVSDNPVLERDVAHLLAKHLDGIGPKQSRNLLQWIGVSKYEIPVDSRITKWLNRNLLKYHLSANLLADHTYYDMVSDCIQLLCKRANVYPCLLDAAIFTSFDGGWSESDIGMSESLETG
jgi:N-glycosylase/DNA lyase